MLLAALAAWATVADLLTPIGRWKTIDDKTGKPKAIVQVFGEDGKLYGKIEATLDPNAKKICDKCKDARQIQPIVGMVIMRGLALRGEECSGGDILDPDNGSVYRCKHVEGHGSVRKPGRASLESQEPPWSSVFVSAPCPGSWWIPTAGLPRKLLSSEPPRNLNCCRAN